MPSLFVASALVFTGTVSANATEPEDLRDGAAVSEVRSSQETNLHTESSALRVEEDAAELPDLLTDEEMEQLTTPKGESELQSPKSAQARSLTGGCHVLPGKLYKRSSGKTYKYGTIGGHPSITCGSIMAKIRLSTTFYKKVSTGWKKISKTFVSVNEGQSHMTQKSPFYACKKYTSTAQFRMVERAQVWYRNGNYRFGAAYAEARLLCA